MQSGYWDQQGYSNYSWDGGGSSGAAQANWVAYIQGLNPSTQANLIVEANLIGQAIWGFGWQHTN